jgi:putative thioredoxin
MPASGFVVNVNEADFEYEVINYSHNLPVVVDFWAAWCVPCKTLGPLLERLAQEGRGAFRLAKVDVDESPNLALRFGVRSIPNVKAFSQGQVVAEFVGLQPEPRVREFINKLAPSQDTLELEKAQGLLEQHRWAEAETIYRRILKHNPDHSAALLGLVKSTLGQGRGRETLPILNEFPASREYSAAQMLRPLAEAIALPPAYEADRDPLGPAFQNSIRLAGRGNQPAAIDGLLDILRENKQYRNGLPRQLVVALLELLGENDPMTRQYRQELASILF